MNAPSFPDQPPEAFEVIWNAEPYHFAIMLLGTLGVLTLLAMGAVMAKFPETQNVPLWVGVWVTLFFLCLVFRKFFFSQRQLQIGSDRFRILDEGEQVIVEVPYAIILSIRLFTRTVTEDRHPEFFNPLEVNDWVVWGAKEALRGIEVSTQKEETFLGIRFHVGSSATLDRQKQVAIAARRGATKGCDWTLGPDVFAAPLAVIKEKIQARWLAYLGSSTSQYGTP